MYSRTIISVHLIIQRSREWVKVVPTQKKYECSTIEPIQTENTITPDNNSVSYKGVKRAINTLKTGKATGINK